MIQFIYIAGINSSSFRFLGPLFRFFSLKFPDLAQAIFVGGLIGFVCYIPSWIAIEHYKISNVNSSLLLWINLIAGALGGLCFTIPVAIGTFIYVINLSEKK